MSRSIVPAAAAAAVLATLACGATARGGPFATPAERDEITLEVQNRNFSQATLWAVIRGARNTRLGDVQGKTDTTFTIPWTFSEPLRIEIDLIAGPRCRTRSIDVDPGDLLRLEIEETFQNTQVCDRTGGQ